jgi:hypothetical protein
MSTQIETGELDRTIIQMEPMQRLVSVLETLVAIYQEAGLDSQGARQAALADLECTFTVLALAA